MSTFSLWSGDVASVEPMHAHGYKVCLQITSELVEDAEIRKMAWSHMQQNPHFKGASIHDSSCAADGFKKSYWHHDVKFQGHNVSMSVWA